MKSIASLRFVVLLPSILVGHCTRVLSSQPCTQANNSTFSLYYTLRQPRLKYKQIYSSCHPLAGNVIMVRILTAIQRFISPVASSLAILFNRRPFATTLCRTSFRDLGLSRHPSRLWETRTSIGGIVGVKSEYMLGVVVPDREGEHHPVGDRVACCIHTTTSRP